MLNSFFFSIQGNCKRMKTKEKNQRIRKILFCLIKGVCKTKDHRFNIIKKREKKHERWVYNTTAEVYLCKMVY